MNKWNVILKSPRLKSQKKRKKNTYTKLVRFK